MSDELKDAKMRIELDPQQAEETLDILAEKVDEIDESIAGTEKDIDKAKAKEKQQKDERGKGGGGEAGRQKPGMDNTQPGRFGLKNAATSALHGNFNVAAVAAGIPIVGAAAVVGIEALKRFGPAGAGALEGLGDELPEGPLRSAFKGLSSMVAGLSGTLNAIETRVNTMSQAFDSATELAKAQLLLGGAVDVGNVADFASQTYDLQFAERSKQLDVRAKTLEAIGSAGTKQLIDALLAATKGGN